MIDEGLIESARPVSEWGMAEVDDYKGLPSALQQLTQFGCTIPWAPMVVPASPLTPGVVKFVVFGLRFVQPQTQPAATASNDQEQPTKENQ